MSTIKINRTLWLFGMLLGSVSILLGCGSSGGSSETTSSESLAPDSISSFSSATFSSSGSSLEYTFSGDSFSTNFFGVTLSGAFTYSKTGDNTANLQADVSNIQSGGLTITPDALASSSGVAQVTSILIVLNFSTATEGSYTSTSTLTDGSTTEESGTFVLN